MNMQQFWATTLDLLAQFTGGRGGIDHNIVQFGLAAIMWTALLVLASVRQQRVEHPHEQFLTLGFSLGLIRELFMFCMALMHAYALVPDPILHVFFPPLEHALFDAAVIAVSAAFLCYIVHDEWGSRRYLRIGLSCVAAVYLLTFVWWGRFILAHPGSRFGQTWCDWLFRINAATLLAFPISVLVRRAHGKTRTVVCAGLACFFLNEFLKIPDMILAEAYESYFAPIRHGLYILGIAILGYVYARELYEEQRQTEFELSESEERYRRLFEESRDAIYVTSREGYFVDINPAGLELFGYGKNEIMHIQVGDLYFDPDGRDKFMEAISEKGAVRDYEVRLRHKDGRQMNCLLTTTQRHGPNATFIGTQGMIRDVTLQRKFEQQFRQTEKMEAMGTLAGGIAHDFNNILTAIIGYAYIANREIEAGSKAQKAIQEIHSAGNRAKDLVKQILAFSRRDEQVKKPLYLQGIIKEALKLLRATIPASIEIRQQISTESCVILAEPTQILQLLLNLSTNAIHAMRGKGVLEISIRRVELGEDQTVLLSGRPPGTYIELAVSDTGCGIDPSIMPKIFDPFFTTKEVGEGTGMGLSVVHGIVKSHAGLLTVDSTPGLGTVFHVYFPLVEKSADEDKAIGILHYTGTERILFVDDEETIAKLGNLTLSRFGYQVTALTSSEEALKLFTENPDNFDLVITDQSMPRLSGSELALELFKVRPRIPIILCTGYSAVISEKEAKELGICEFVVKPLVERKLAKVVRKVLDNPECRESKQPEAENC